MKSITILLITFYKNFISPFLEAIFGHACRFEITCSEYTLDMVKKFGAGKGVYLGLIRLSKCHTFKFPISNFQFPIKFKLSNYKFKTRKFTGDWKLETGNQP